jgi:hypothetical protein
MNKEVVNSIISMKQQVHAPYSASITKTMTDMDVFPYPRFYRGDYKSDSVFIFEREAGFKPRRDECYHDVSNLVKEEFYPNHCWQAAPSTQYPCYPEYLRKDSDKKELSQQLFRTNVNEYR